ncbi:MAG: hypothetical protein HZA79_04905 [Sphingobacteriales bacterium]|nr:hypothetical protein [Sphingobacteriales bacterium]
MIFLLTGIFIPLAVFPQQAKEQYPQFRLNGYINDLQGLSFPERWDSLSTVNLLHNRVNISAQFSPKLSGRLELRNRFFWGDQLQQVPDFGKLISEYNGWSGLSKIWIRKKKMVFHTVADRMLLKYSTGHWDITAGRQRINWGINNAWNPNDIFNAWNFLDFDYAERPGSDALRIQYSLPGNATWELAWKPGQRQAEHIAAFLYKFNKKKYDFQFLGGLWQQDLVIGGGWAGSIKNAGFKGELSYFHPQQIRDTTGTLSFSLMADQTFKKDWYLALSVLFNSNPSNLVSGTGNLFGNTLSAKSLFPFRYTFYAGALKAFSPLSSLNTAIIYSPEKHFLILFPNWSRNLSENFDIDFTAQVFFSKDLSGYKMRGSSFFIRGRWNF